MPDLDPDHHPGVRRPAPRLTIELPAEWEDRSILTFVGKEERGFRPSLLISRRPAAGADLAAFVTEQEQSLRKQLLRVQQHGRRELTIAGRSAVLLDFSFHSKEAGPLRQLLAFVAMDNELVTASVTGGAPTFDQHRAEYEDMLESLSFEG